MARDNLKKAYKSSLSRLSLYRTITVSINLIWLLYTIFYCDESFGGGYGCGTWFGLTFWLSHELLCEYALRFLFAPVLDDAGNVVDCNDITDVSKLGSFSYAQDTLWICWFVQLSSLLTRLSYLLYACVPLFLMYKFSYMIGPYLLQGLSILLKRNGENPSTNQTERSKKLMSHAATRSVRPPPPERRSKKATEPGPRRKF